MNRKESISESTKIQWHPGFYAATEIELRSNKNDLLDYAYLYKEAHDTGSNHCNKRTEKQRASATEGTFSTGG